MLAALLDLLTTYSGSKAMHSQQKRSGRDPRLAFLSLAQLRVADSTSSCDWSGVPTAGSACGVLIP